MTGISENNDGRFVIEVCRALVLEVVAHLPLVRRAFAVIGHCFSDSVLKGELFEESGYFTQIR